MAGTREAPAPAQDDFRWFAVYTRSRHEKQVERLLADRARATYLPLLERERRWSDRTRRIEWPLFPGYVFAQTAPPLVHRILELPGVVDVVRQNGQPAVIAAGELDNVRRFVVALARTEQPVTPVPLLAAGQWVEILSGPFAGVRAQVIEQRTRRRVVVGLPALGQGYAINVEHTSLRPLPEDAA